MTEPKEPREWTLQWINDIGKWQVIGYPSGNKIERETTSPPFARAIELHNYQALQAELEKVKAELERTKDAVNYQIEKYQKLDTKPSDFQIIEHQIETIRELNSDLDHLKLSYNVMKDEYASKLATEKARAQRLGLENKTLKTITAKLWQSLKYFSASEFDLKPDGFHDLIEEAHKLNEPFRKQALAEYKDGK